MSNFWDDLMETDEGAANYMASYGEGPGFATRVMVGEFINDGESVLDVGCGPGWNLDHFYNFGPKVSKYQGLDYSPRFVRVANQRREKEGYPEDIYLPYKVGDVREIAQPMRSWDVVLMQDVLEHTNGYEKPVKEALRVARRRIIISFWHLDGNDGTEHINDDGNDGWGAWYDKNSWEEYLDTLSYPWFHTDLAPKDKTHVWHFYIIDKEPGV